MEMSSCIALNVTHLVPHVWIKAQLETSISVLRALRATLCEWETLVCQNVLPVHFKKVMNALSALQNAKHVRQVLKIAYPAIKTLTSHFCLTISASKAVHQEWATWQEFASTVSIRA